MKDLKSGIEHLKQAKAHMSKANGIMSNCISKLKFLEEENAELRAKLADWGGQRRGLRARRVHEAAAGCGRNRNQARGQDLL